MPENTNRSLVFDAEGISYKMECGISALDAIRTAMDEGPAAAETFTGALYCVWGYLSGLQKEMDQIIYKLIKGDTE